LFVTKDQVMITSNSSSASEPNADNYVHFWSFTPLNRSNHPTGKRCPTVYLIDEKIVDFGGQSFIRDADNLSRSLINFLSLLLLTIPLGTHPFHSLRGWFDDENDHKAFCFPD